MTDEPRPWWSSGSGPDARVEPGPAADDRRARRGPDGPGGGPDDGRARSSGRDEHGRSEDGAHAHDPGAHTHHGTAPPLSDGEVCQVCPICTALRLVGEVRPDLLVHLAEAARHLTLAAKTIVDAQAAGYRDRGLEHIPLDDDPT